MAFQDMCVQLVRVFGCLKLALGTTQVTTQRVKGPHLTFGGENTPLGCRGEERVSGFHGRKRWTLFKLPWCKAGLLKSSRRLSGFGPGGCQ